MYLCWCYLFTLIVAITVKSSLQTTRCPPLHLTNGRVRLRAVGRMATFRCDPKFRIVGARQAMCLSSGMWNFQKTPMCLGTECPQIDVLAGGTIKELYNGSMLEFECALDLRLEGSQRILCLGTSWDSAPPTCISDIVLPLNNTGCDHEDQRLCTPSDYLDYDANRTSTQVSREHSGSDYKTYTNLSALVSPVTMTGCDYEDQTLCAQIDDSDYDANWTRTQVDTVTPSLNNASYSADLESPPNITECEYEDQSLCIWTVYDYDFNSTSIQDGRLSSELNSTSDSVNITGCDYEDQSLCTWTDNRAVDLNWTSTQGGMAISETVNTTVSAKAPNNSKNSSNAEHSPTRHTIQAQITQSHSKTTPVRDSQWRTSVKPARTTRNRKPKGNKSTSAPKTMSAFTRSLKTSVVTTSASFLPKSLSTMPTSSTTTTASPSILTTLSTTYTSTSAMPTSSTAHTSSPFIHTSTSTISMSTSTTPLSTSTDPTTASGTMTVTSTSTTAAATGETMAVSTNYTTTQFLPPSTTAAATTPAEVTTKAKPLSDIHALQTPVPEWQESTEIPLLLSSLPPDFTSKNNNSNRPLMLTPIRELTTPRKDSLDENKLNQLTLFSFNTSSVLHTVNKSLAWVTLAVAKPEPATGSSRLSDINSTPTLDSVSTTALPALQSTTSIYFSDDIISESTSVLLSASSPSSTATAKRSATSLPGSRVTTRLDSSDESTSVTVGIASLTSTAIESFSHDTWSATSPTQGHGASVDRNGTSDEKHSAGVDSHNQTTLGYGRSHSVKHQISVYLPLIVGGLVVGLFLISSLVFVMDRRLRKRREQKLEEEQKKIFSSLEGNPYRV